MFFLLLNKKMKKLLTYLVCFIMLMFNYLTSFSQSKNIDTLVYHSYSIIPYQYDFEGVKVGGISGIENLKDNTYLMITDAPRKNSAVIFNIDFDILKDTVLWQFNGKIVLKNKKIRPEAIRKNKKTDDFFITDERSEKSFFGFLDLKKKLKFKKFYKTKHSINNGLEGLCFNEDCSKAYISLEMINERDSMTVIKEYDFETQKITEYSYKLDVADKLFNQYYGISELLFLSENTILVVERAYIRRIPVNKVKVYKVTLNTKTKKVEKQKLLTDFSDLPNSVKLDNIEAATFSNDLKSIIFVSDDNMNTHQTTQILIYTKPLL